MFASSIVVPAVEVVEVAFMAALPVIVVLVALVVSITLVVSFVRKHIEYGEEYMDRYGD